MWKIKTIMLYKTFKSFKTSFWIYEINEGWNKVLNSKCFPTIDEGVTIYYNKEIYLLNFYITHPAIGTIKIVADITSYLFSNVFVAINCDCDKKQVDLFTGSIAGGVNDCDCVTISFAGKSSSHFAYRKGDIFLVTITGEDIPKMNGNEHIAAAELLSESVEAGHFKLINRNKELVNNGKHLQIPRDRILPIHTMRM